MAFQVPYIQRYCTCTDEFYNPTFLANRQHEYEKFRLEGDTVFDALQKMGLVRLCCREAVFNPTTLFLNSENERRIRDEIKRFVIDNPDTAEILPKRPLPELPS
jgi:hypothetical protein